MPRSKPVAPSYAHQGLSDPGEWLQKISGALRTEAEAIKAQADQASSLSPSFGLTFQMVDAATQEAIQEADRLATLALFAAIEAAFQLDYLSRVSGKHRPKSAKRIRRSFKDVANALKAKRLTAPSMETLIDAWQVEFNDTRSPKTKQKLGQLKGCYRYRHWLAHGRYWSLRQDQVNHDDLFVLADEVIAVMQRAPLGFRG